MIRSLQTRLLLAVGLLALVAVAAVAVAVRQGAREEFLRFQESEERSALDAGVQRSRAIAERLERGATLSEAVAALPPTLAVFVIDDEDGRFIAAAGAPLAQAGSVTASRRGSTLVIEATVRRGAVLASIGLKLMQRGEPVRWADGRRARLYVVPFPDEARERSAEAFLGSLDRRLLLATTLVAILALGVTWTLARRTVRPIDELRAAARDLGRRDFSRRVMPHGQDEVAELGRAFNAMAEELERQQMLRRALVHDVAHELRTPLTALRCRVESVTDGLAADPGRALSDVREEVLHLSRLVDDLQELALAEARELRLDVAVMALGDLVRSAVRAAGLEGDARLRVSVPDGLTLCADAVRVRQILLNLLTNADRHTPPDGSIVIGAAPGESTVAVEVENTGSTLTSDQLARLFDRFYRTDPSRQRTTGGTGLGLAIVKHLVEAQGGRVWARSGPSSVTVGFALATSEIAGLQSEAGSR